jgi:biopolymer transport protein ExbD
MVINLILRMILLALVPVSLFGAAFGAAFGAEGDVAPKTVDYKRADTNFYARGDVLKADPNAIILPQAAFAQNGDTYTYTPKKKAPKIVYVEAPGDWVEPITPPDMPASLDIAPDAMQIREPQGDVQVALPAAPANFAPVIDGMSLPNGAVVKTGTNATAAILFGGVDSARLMPDSEAAVQQSVTPQSRSAEVDLTAGGIFAKVGTQTGVNGEFQVHTASGNAISQGGDFAALTDNGRTDVWVERGTVKLLRTDGQDFGMATGDGTGPLKLIRFPAITDPAKSLLADAESLTAIMNFIPIANQKLAALHAKQTRGTPLTANEQAYLERVKQVPTLIKLALVEPPPAPAPPPAPGLAGPTQELGSPNTVTLHADGTIEFQGASSTLDGFKAKAADFAAANPGQPIFLKVDSSLSHAQVQAVVSVCREAHIQQVKVTLMESAPGAPVTPAPKPAPPEPVTVILHPNGTIKFQGVTTGLAEFVAKLKALIAAKPDQAIIIKASPLVPYAKFTELLDACKSSQVREIAVAPPSPQPPAAPESVPPPAAEATAPPAAPANPDVTTVTPKPIAAMEPLTVLVHEDGRVGFRGTKTDLVGFQAKLKAMVKGTPDRDLVIKAEPQTSYDKIKAVLDSCADAQVHHVTAPEPAPPVTAETPPVSPTAETPPAPAQVPVNDKAVPAEIDLAADGSLTLDGAPVTEDDLKGKLADIAKTNPKNPLVMMKQPKVSREQWQHYVTLCHSMGLKLLVKDAKLTAGVSAPPTPTAEPPMPRPTAAEGSPTLTPAKTSGLTIDEQLKQGVIPVRLGLDAQGQIDVAGVPTSEDDLKTRLTSIAAANPDQPVVLVKKKGVTVAQWQHVVDLVHEAKLRVRVYNNHYHSPVPLPSPSTESPPAAAEGAPEAPAPHLSASPAPAPEPAPNVPSAPPEIELTPDGHVSFLGEAVSEADLKTRLDSVAQSNSGQPVTIVKDEKVTHDQLQRVVDICHAAKLKVRVKTVKSSDTGAWKLRAQGPSGITESSAPAAAPAETAPADVPTPHLAASVAPEKLLPVEIGMTPDGNLTFEGTKVTGDELKEKLATIAQVNPRQPVVIVKKGDIPRDSVNAIIVLCHEASLKVTVKTAKAFVPAPPETATTSASTRDPNAPAFHLTPSIDTPESSSSTTPTPSP